MTMLRKCLTAMAIAAVAAVVALAPVSSAEAGPGVSPFAGSYVGSDPLGWFGGVPVTISDQGQITHSYSDPDSRYKRSLSGRVRDDGRYSFTVTETVPDQIPNWRDTGPSWVTLRYTVSGNMALDADGNIVGTGETGSQVGVVSFFWLRQ